MSVLVFFDRRVELLAVDVHMQRGYDAGAFDRFEHAQKLLIDDLERGRFAIDWIERLQLVFYRLVVADFNVDDHFFRRDRYFLLGVGVENVKGYAAAVIVRPFGVVLLVTDFHDVSAVRAVMDVVMVVRRGLTAFFRDCGAAWLVTAAAPKQPQTNGQGDWNGQKISRHWLGSFDSFDPGCRNGPSTHRNAIDESGEYAASNAGRAASIRHRFVPDLQRITVPSGQAALTDCGLPSECDWTSRHLDKPLA
jgi:hypothetical protein